MECGEVKTHGVEWGKSGAGRDMPSSTVEPNQGTHKYSMRMATQYYVKNTASTVSKIKVHKKNTRLPRAHCCECSVFLGNLIP